MEKKILYYLNQFFGQIGGEDKADYPANLVKEPVGPAVGFEKELGGAGKVVATLICGDNYFNENKEQALEYIKKAIEEVKPDLIVAGPAFNAGRYGMACAGVVTFAEKEFGIKSVTGMYEENPGLDACRGISYVVPTGAAAGDMRAALPNMAKIAKKVLNNEDVRPADGYFAQGRRETILVQDIGAKRAVDMLMKRLNNQPFETELPMPEFDTVEPAPAIKDLKKAVIALVTSGGIVPNGNPDRIAGQFQRRIVVAQSHQHHQCHRRQRQGDRSDRLLHAALSLDEGARDGEHQIGGEAQQQQGQRLTDNVVAQR